GTRHVRRTLVAAAAAVGGIVLGVAAPADARPAVTPTNVPTPLAGVDNGYVGGDRLITAGPGCRMSRAAGPSLALVFRSAAAAGVRLDGADCYRPVNEQVAVAGQWTAAGNSACAATPQRFPDGRPKGTSMHGWGKAIDIADGGNPMTFTSPGYRWMKANA